MYRLLLPILAAATLLCAVGCSSNYESPIAPDSIDQPGFTGDESQWMNSGKLDIPPADESSRENFRAPLGFYALTANPENGTLDIEVLRNADMHLNIIGYLENGTDQFITLAGAPKFSNGGKQLDANIKITHPLANPLFTVFDVHGILLARGSIADWAASDVFIPGQGKTRLINADGFTRWWNPKEFKKPAPYGYKPGVLGNPIPIFQAATVNGYKTFADDLDAESDLSELDPVNRAMFSAGSVCIRHYTISLMGGLKFNYAIDASWAFPTATPPTPPDDFPMNANMLEPYWVHIEEWNNTLWYKPSTGGCGGNVFYHVTIYDWQGVDTIGPARIEIPGIDVDTELTEVLEETANWIEYDFRVILPGLYNSDNLEVLVTVDSLEGSYQPTLTNVDKPLRTYNYHITEVSGIDPGENIPAVALMEATTDTVIKAGESVTFDASGSYDPDGNIIKYEWDFNGDEIYSDAFDSGTSINPTKIFNDKGLVDVRIRVMDNDYDKTVSEPVTVDVQGSKPTANGEILGQPPFLMYYNYKLSAEGSFDPDGTIEAYEWDIDYDGENFNPTVFGELVTVTWDLDGDYNIMLRVEDNDGEEDFIDQPLSITVDFNDNHPPLLDELSVDRTTVYRGSIEEVVAITMSAHDPDGGDLEYLWAAESGSFSDETIPNPTWTSSTTVGKVYLTCTISDDQGAWIEVQAPKIRVTNLQIIQPAPAPDYESDRLIGEGSFSLSQYTPGCVILMNFWSTW